MANTLDNLVILGTLCLTVAHATAQSEVPIKVVVVKSGVFTVAEEKMRTAPSLVKLAEIAKTCKYTLVDLKDFMLAYEDDGFGLKEAEAETQLLEEIAKVSGSVLNADALSQDAQATLRKLIYGKGNNDHCVEAAKSPNLRLGIQEMATFHARLGAKEDDYFLHPDVTTEMMREAGLKPDDKTEGSQIKTNESFIPKLAAAKLSFSFSDAIEGPAKQMEFADKCQHFLLEQIKLARRKFNGAMNPLKDAANARLAKCFKNAPGERLPSIDDLNSENLKPTGDFYAMGLGNAANGGMEKGWSFLENAQVTKYTPEMVLTLIFPDPNYAGSAHIVLIQLPCPLGP